MAVTNLGKQVEANSYEVATALQQIIDSYKTFKEKVKTLNVKDKEINGETITAEDIRIHNLFMEVKKYMAFKLNELQVNSQNTFEFVEDTMNTVEKELGIKFTDEQWEDTYSLAFQKDISIKGIYEQSGMAYVETIAIADKAIKKIEEDLKNTPKAHSAEIKAMKEKLEHFKHMKLEAETELESRKGDDNGSTKPN